MTTLEELISCAAWQAMRAKIRAAVQINIEY